MGRYVPAGPTTQGGIGTVDFWLDQNLDRKVAVKSLRYGGEHRRLLDELAALQRIRSPHVVEVFDVIYLEGGARMGIVEEFIDGQSITTMLGKVDGDEFSLLLYQLASGLADIHAVGMVHRDIKPSNLIRDQEGLLKIIDFNLARPTSDAETRGFVGTRGYAAPELYESGDVRFDASVDVYAFGICAWALLHGAKLPQLLATRPPQPDRWREGEGGFLKSSASVDRSLKELLNACVVERPSKRPTSATLRDRLSRHLLRGQHRAVLTYGSQRFTLDSSSRSATLRHPQGFGIAKLQYDGLDFKVAEHEGEVWINNMQVVGSTLLPTCCVIALGSPSRTARERTFVTMDVSHPEVVI